jgi:hypothetical protein
MAMFPPEEIRSLKAEVAELSRENTELHRILSIEQAKRVKFSKSYEVNGNEYSKLTNSNSAISELTLKITKNISESNLKIEKLTKKVAETTQQNITTTKNLLVDEVKCAALEITASFSDDTLPTFEHDVNSILEKFSGCVSKEEKSVLVGKLIIDQNFISGLMGRMNDVVGKKVGNCIIIFHYFVTYVEFISDGSEK